MVTSKQLAWFGVILTVLISFDEIGDFIYSLSQSMNIVLNALPPIVFLVIIILILIKLGNKR